VGGDEPGEGGFFHRVTDRIQEAVGGGGKVEDVGPRRETGPPTSVPLPPPVTVPPPTPIPVRINLSVDCTRCCCCSHDPCRCQPALPGSKGRPTHQTGTSDGTLGPITGVGGVVGVVTRPPSVWPGPRKDLYLPFLFIRATAGDTGTRPVAGVFWESPDIFVLPGVAPASAPAMPPTLGGVAQAGVDNTIYAHVWNLGQAPAFDVLVEFYWFNPALGFSDADANLIGATWTNLGPRGGTGSHRLVKCPLSWHATFLNGGHECLMVRLSQPVTDPLSAPAWDARANRHIGQRNIHVMSAAEAAAKPTLGIEVGPLFGGVAQVGVARMETNTMPWLHLVTMSRTATFGTGAPTGDVGLTPPVPAGSPLPNLGAVPDPRGAGLVGDAHGVTADGQQVGFHATDGNPGNGQAHLYRVTGTQDGSVFGGYTVVVLGDH
jgi:hypothetical protein